MSVSRYRGGAAFFLCALNNAGRETNESGNDRSFAIGVPLISRASVLRETVKAANIKSGSLKYKLAVLRVA